MSGDRLSRWLVCTWIAAVTLAVVPGGETPFSGVKTGLVAAGSAALLLRAFVGASRPAPLAPRVLAGLWIASLAFSSLIGPAARPGGMWLDAAAGCVLLALLQAPFEPRAPMRAVAGAGTALALVAVLQFLGWDPFRWMGWSSSHPGERMRIYGTLGNPDFVAAYLGVSLCLVVGEFFSANEVRWRRLWLAAAVLQLCALAATRSWGTLPALGAAALSLVWTRGSEPTGRLEGSRRLGWRAVVFAILGVVLLLGAVWGRSLGAVVEGRLYLWRVAAPRVLEAPMFGHGPGSFRVLWPSWEAEYWAHGGSAAQEGFVALQDHAHFDYLEWLLELGLVGVVPRMLLVLLALRAGRQWQETRGRAAVAALVALAVRALVDFPLARPAELCLFCVLLALTLGEGSGSRRVLAGASAQADANKVW
ncbi:O-antigen ligase family protein [Hyalangium versicolor]|uniref:O-antigen ligase family protein n=1 Tax=Hyalangium versicolor TaxID=2861190 RepID=UPI001CCF0F21|nr:O-antigen ligase family protein [Hyalangium versicolor]